MFKNKMLKSKKQIAQRLQEIAKGLNDIELKDTLYNLRDALLEQVTYPRNWNEVDFAINELLDDLVKYIKYNYMNVINNYVLRLDSFIDIRKNARKFEINKIERNQFISDNAELMEVDVLIIEISKENIELFELENIQIEMSSNIDKNVINIEKLNIELERLYNKASELSINDSSEKIYIVKINNCEANLENCKNEFNTLYQQNQQIVNSILQKKEYIKQLKDKLFNKTIIAKYGIDAAKATKVATENEVTRIQYHEKSKEIKIKFAGANKENEDRYIADAKSIMAKINEVRAKKHDLKDISLSIENQLSDNLKSDNKESE